MLSITKTIKISLLTGSLLFSPLAFADNAEDRYLYIGTELGISEPLVKSFDYKADSGTTPIRLKQSKMVGGRVGYSFYPGMMVELSWTHQPKFTLAYVLPEVDLSNAIPGITLPGFAIPKTHGKTKIVGNVVTLNLIYEMQEQFAGIKPYFIAGAGVANIKIKPTISSTDKLEVLTTNKVEPFFKIRKNNINCFVWQVGGGISKDLGDNFAVDLGAKLQVVNDIKIKYEQCSSRTFQFIPQKPIKKTIAVGEFTLGFTFKLPV